MLFLSSDHTRKYSEDILTALALPRGALLQFRYESVYVAPSAVHMLAAGSVSDVEAIIGFVSGVGAADPFVLPVRYATVSSVERSADFYFFKFKVESHVDLAEYPMEFDRLVGDSAEVLRRMREKEKGAYYPVISSPPNLRVRPAGDAPTQWRDTVRRLAKHPTFERSSFVRIDSIRTERGKELAFDERGRLMATEGTALRVPATFYTEKYVPDAKRALKCDVDGTFLRASSEAAYEISHRYDTVEFWLHPSVRDVKALARVRLSAEDASQGESTVQTKVSIAVVIQRARPRLLLRAATAGIGAALVALPAILGQSASVGLRILSAGAGAILIAAVSVFMGPTK